MNRVMRPDPMVPMPVMGLRDLGELDAQMCVCQVLDPHVAVEGRRVLRDTVLDSPAAVAPGRAGLVGPQRRSVGQSLQVTLLAGNALDRQRSVVDASPGRRWNR